MSPKSVFQDDQTAASEHRKIASKPEIRAALLVAFNELCWNLPAADNPQTSWGANARRQGAQDLISIFLGLGDQPQPRKNPIAGLLEDEDATYRKRTSTGPRPTKP